MAQDASRYVGRMLPGGFRVQRYVASGGFAWVYEAYGPGQKRCAIKIPFRLEGDAVKRFVREIKVLRALPPNRHCVGYVGDGQTDERIPFLAMEYIDGITLGQALKRRPVWNTEEACKLMIQLAKAYSGQHQLGLANRDVKPDNIMITREGMVKVMDFGLVKDAQGLLKLFESEDILSGRHFAENLDRGVLAGSPEYMAPEQFTDSSLSDPANAQTDTWTDVYSLGLIFYQLLSGEKLFRFESTPNAPPPLYAKELLRYVEMRIATRDDTIERHPNIDPALWPALERALRGPPRRRYADAQKFAEDIEQFHATGEIFDVQDEVTSIADAGMFLQAHLQAVGGTSERSRADVAFSEDEQTVAGVRNIPRSAPAPRQNTGLGATGGDLFAEDDSDFNPFEAASEPLDPMSPDTEDHAPDEPDPAAFVDESVRTNPRVFSSAPRPSPDLSAYSSEYIVPSPANSPSTPERPAAPRASLPPARPPLRPPPRRPPPAAADAPRAASPPRVSPVPPRASSPPRASFPPIPSSVPAATAERPPTGDYGRPSIASTPPKKSTLWAVLLACLILLLGSSAALAAAIWW
ncbi:MAG: protein kinase [Myxococcota bacterium]